MRLGTVNVVEEIYHSIFRDSKATSAIVIKYMNWVRVSYQFLKLV